MTIEVLAVDVVKMLLTAGHLFSATKTRLHGVHIMCLLC